MNYYSAYSSPFNSLSFGFMGIFMLFATVIGFAVAFTIGYLIYKDAKKHNIENPALWGVISGITWIGILLYFVINKREK